MKDTYYHGVRDPLDLPKILQEGLSRGCLTDLQVVAFRFMADYYLLLVEADVTGWKITEYDEGFQYVIPGNVRIPPEDIKQIPTAEVITMVEKQKELDTERKKITNP